MSAARAEVRLLAACARREPDLARVGALVDAGIDWEVLLHLARWHGLRPLLQRGLDGAGVDRAPRAVRVALWGECEQVARRNRAMAGELARCMTLLRDAGVHALAFKGPTLAVLAYGDLALREFGDLDILVARSGLARARALLEAAGYVPEYPLAPPAEAAYLAARMRYDLVLRSPAGCVVELHWKSDADHVVERMDDAPWLRSGTRVDLAGAQIATLPPEDLLLLLCIHGSKHQWSSLAWVADVAELAARVDDAGWGRIAARAAGLGCTRRVGTGLALVRALWGVALPGHAAALAGSPGVEPIVRALAARLGAPSPEVPGPVRALRTNLALYETARERIRHVGEVVFLPSLVEWTRWPLPRMLYFLYPMLRVARLVGRAAAGLFRSRKLQT